jgi:hypothetical protein
MRRVAVVGRRLERVGSALNNNLSSPVALTAATKLVTLSNSDRLTAAPTGVMTANGKPVTFSTSQTTSTTDAAGNVTIGACAGSTLTVDDELSRIRASSVLQLQRRVREKPVKHREKPCLFILQPAAVAPCAGFPTWLVTRANHI